MSAREKVPAPDTRALVGVHLCAKPPIGRMAIAFRPGLTALYGKNGVGKTRLLAELSRVLSGADPAPAYLTERAKAQHFVRTTATPMIATYFRSAVHWVWPLSRVLWEDADYLTPITEALDAALLAAAPEPAFDDILVLPPPNFMELHQARRTMRRGDWDEVVLIVMDRLGFDAPVEEVEYLLAQGRWLVVNETSTPAYLCDPNPTDGPLRERWAAEATK